MRFEFEYEDEWRKWRAFGVGEGSGDAAVADALTDLSDGKTLASGRYRCRPIDGTTETWHVFVLDPEGRISTDPESA